MKLYLLNGHMTPILRIIGQAVWEMDGWMDFFFIKLKQP